MRHAEIHVPFIHKMPWLVTRLGGLALEHEELPVEAVELAGHHVGGLVGMLHGQVGSEREKVLRLLQTLQACVWRMCV